MFVDKFYLFFHYPFLGHVYTNATYDHACCVELGSHSKCHCDSIHDNSSCRSICSDDIGCRGYVMHDDPSNKTYCQIAIIFSDSICPSGCRGPDHSENIHPTKPNAKCGTEENWDGGCKIQESGNR